MKGNPDFDTLEIGGPIYQAGGTIKDQYGVDCSLTGDELRAMVPDILDVKTVFYRHNRDIGHVGNIFKAYVDQTDTLHIDAKLSPPITCKYAKLLRTAIVNGKLRSWSLGWNEDSDGKKRFVEASIVPVGHFKKGKITRVRMEADSQAQTVFMMPLGLFTVSLPKTLPISTKSILGGQRQSHRMSVVAAVGTTAPLDPSAQPVANALDASLAAVAVQSSVNATTPELPTDLMTELANFRAEKLMLEQKKMEIERNRIMNPQFCEQLSEYVGNQVLPENVSRRLRATAGGSSSGLSYMNANLNNQAAVAAGMTVEHGQEIEHNTKALVADLCQLAGIEAGQSAIRLLEDRANEITALRTQLQAQTSRTQTMTTNDAIRNQVERMTTDRSERFLRTTTTPRADPVADTLLGKRPAEDSELRAGAQPAKRARPTTGPATEEDFLANIYAAFADPKNYHPPGAPMPKDVAKFDWKKSDASKSGGLPIFTRSAPSA